MPFVFYPELFFIQLNFLRKGRGSGQKGRVTTWSADRQLFALLHLYQKQTQFIREVPCHCRNLMEWCEHWISDFLFVCSYRRNSGSQFFSSPPIYGSYRPWWKCYEMSWPLYDSGFGPVAPCAVAKQIGGQTRAILMEACGWRIAGGYPVFGCMGVYLVFVCTRGFVFEFQRYGPNCIFINIFACAREPTRGKMSDRIRNSTKKIDKIWYISNFCKAVTLSSQTWSVQKYQPFRRSSVTGTLLPHASSLGRHHAARGSGGGLLLTQATKWHVESENRWRGINWFVWLIISGIKYHKMDKIAKGKPFVRRFLVWIS